jgi:transposase
MHDRQVFSKLLGVVAPWEVEHVDLRLEEGEVHISVRHRRGATWPCPRCGRRCKLHDHQPERSWRHLDVFEYQTILHAEPPRCNCEEHGVQVVSLPWAEKGSRFTALFERWAIMWLQMASQSAVARQLDLSWDEVHAIQQRAVKRGLKRRKIESVPVIGIDEKAYKKGHRYLTLVYDHANSRVLYVGDERKESSLQGFWDMLTADQKAGIEAVSMDMWDPFINSVRANVPNAEEKIVFDKYHIASHLGNAVDLVRRGENKALRSTGDDRLVGSKYDWLTNPANFTAKAWREFTALRTSDLKTARAWALKENAMYLFDYTQDASARRHFRSWYNWATHSRLKPMISVAKMLKRRFDNIITYLKHPITNAISESINSRIQWVQFTARGFRNKGNFMTSIYFHCGGLDLMPTST